MDSYWALEKVAYLTTLEMTERGILEFNTVNKMDVMFILKDLHPYQDFTPIAIAYWLTPCVVLYNRPTDLPRFTQVSYGDCL